jgi:hypothetical protein
VPAAASTPMASDEAEKKEVKLWGGCFEEGVTCCGRSTTRGIQPFGFCVVRLSAGALARPECCDLLRFRLASGFIPTGREIVRGSMCSVGSRMLNR